MIDHSLVIKSGLWYVFANILIKGIGFFTTPFFARILTKAEYGYFANFLSVLNLLVIVCGLNLSSTIISARFDYKNQFDRYLSAILFLSTFSIGFWYIIFLSNSDFFVNLLGIEYIHINLIFAYIVFLSSVELFQNKERFLYRYKNNVSISLLLCISTTVLSIILVSINENKLYYRIIGHILPTIIIGIVLYLKIIWNNINFSFTMWRYALSISIPIVPHLLSLTFLNTMDVIMIRSICGNESAAIYSIGHIVGIVIAMITNAMNNAFSPWLGDKLNNKEYSILKCVSTVYIKYYMILVIFFALIAPEILIILGGKTYLDSKYVILPVMLGCVCQFIYTFFVSTQQFLRKTTGLAFCTFCAAIINFVLNYLFIPKFGYIAGAYTTCCSLFILMLLHMFRVYLLGINIAFDYRRILLCLFIISICLSIISLSYDNIQYRTVGIIAYIIFLCCLLYKKYDYIINEIKNILRR
ncbi:MAG: oligosaccharide flippase family protein [Phascolarctobacterium sp.]|nr:oligosaccharide flippase family protein [Phascolarctobacterium sp.]